MTSRKRACVISPAILSFYIRARFELLYSWKCRRGDCDEVGLPPARHGAQSTLLALMRSNVAQHKYKIQNREKIG